MTYTVNQLIKELEQVENKEALVYAYDLDSGDREDILNVDLDCLGVVDINYETSYAEEKE